MVAANSEGPTDNRRYGLANPPESRDRDHHQPHPEKCSKFPYQSALQRVPRYDGDRHDVGGGRRSRDESQNHVF